jgi:hypothetical protein
VVYGTNEPRRQSKVNFQEKQNSRREVLRFTQRTNGNPM